MTQTAPLILVDGSSYLYRAYHAMPPLTNSDGEATGTSYGVINMLRKLIRDYQPEHMAVVFDAKGKTFRNDLYAEYKATRPPMPDDLREQIEPIHEIVKAMGLPLLCIDNVEADDVIGTLAKQATAAGIETVISTGDKDMAQLVSKHVTLVNTMNNTKTDIAAVQEKFGLTPQQIVDYLALMGDKVDNIPGVDSVGPKTATKLLQQYGSLQGVIEHADEVKGKLGEKLRAAVDALPLSYQLATIKMDVELDFTPETLDMQVADNQKLAELYRRYEFKSWLQELDSAPAAGPSTKTDEPATSNETYYETILTQQQLDSWMDKLKKAELFAFDTETTSLNYLQARIVGMSFAIKAGEAAYLPLAHDYPGAPDQLDFDATLALMKPLLEDPKALKVGQNLKYDRHILLNHGINLQGIAHDTMLQSYVLDSTATRHDMDSLAEKYLGRSTIHFEDIAGKGKKQLTFNEIGLEEASPYACEDADITLQLHHVLWPKVQAIPSLETVYRELEMPLLPVLNTLERNGVHIDIFMLQQQSDQLALDIDRLEKEAHASAGTKFNLGSPKQLQEILYDQQQLPVRTKRLKANLRPLKMCCRNWQMMAMNFHKSL